MSSKVTAYDVLISCPSDVSIFIPCLEHAISDINHFYGTENNIVLRPRLWTKDTYSTLHKTPQQQINQQIVLSSDIAIALFWTRFGTPTENFGSGTEEEIEWMISAGKQVFLFFLDKPISPSAFDQLQYASLLSFKKKHMDDGLSFTIGDESADSVKASSQFRSTPPMN